MFGGGLQDEMLKAFVDKIFDKYDTDKNGTLDEDEMTNFFNELFQKLGINQNINREQTLEAIKEIDQNFDGKIDKTELFLAFKKMIEKNQANIPPPPPPPSYPGGYGGYPYNGYPNYPQYPPGYGGYGGYGGYPPPPQPQGYPQSPFYPQYPPQPNPMYGSGQYGYPGNQGMYGGQPGMFNSQTYNQFRK